LSPCQCLSPPSPLFLYSPSCPLCPLLPCSLLGVVEIVRPSIFPSTFRIVCVQFLSSTFAPFNFFRFLGCECRQFISSMHLRTKQCSQVEKEGEWGGRQQNRKRQRRRKKLSASPSTMRVEIASEASLKASIDLLA
jgi:hypothetical protein